MNMIFTISMSEHYSHSYYHDNPSSYYYYYRSRGFPIRASASISPCPCPCVLARLHLRPRLDPRLDVRNGETQTAGFDVCFVCLFSLAFLGWLRVFFEVKTSQHATARSRTIAFEGGPEHIAKDLDKQKMQNKLKY